MLGRGGNHDYYFGGWKYWHYEEMLNRAPLPENEIWQTEKWQAALSLKGIKLYKMPSDPAESFRTHSNYIQAFRLLVHDPISSLRRNIYALLRGRILDGNALPQSSGAIIDLDQVRSSLHSAWGTETLLSMTCRIIDEEELLRLSNNWSAIQVYYVFYHCTQALHVAKGHPRPESHPSTQQLFYDYWAARSICLPPWSLAFGVDGAKNAPPGITADVSVHAWTACAGDNIWSLVFKALMTTRRERLDEKYRELRESKKRLKRRAWKRQEDGRIARGRKPRLEPNFPLPRLTEQEKEQADNRLRPFSIMDYLYRVRIKTNYEDSNMFSDGPEDNNSSRRIRSAFCIMASGTLFLHELAIRNLVGREIFLAWADEWIRKNMPQNLNYGLVTRRQYLA